jgi:hypothetical protein
MPIYWSTKESSSTIREIAIKKVVRHSIRKHPGSAVVAAFCKRQDLNTRKKTNKHLSEEKYYDDWSSSSGVCVGGEPF